MEEQTPYDEGKLAFGEPQMRDCPYPWGNPSWREWWKGWREADTLKVSNNHPGGKKRMTSVYRTTHTVQITTGQATLTLDIPEAHELLAQLTNALGKDDTPVALPVSLLGADEAQDIARETFGMPIPKSTLVSAWPTMPGAEKVGGRWKVPLGSFQEWLETWASKQ